MKHNKVTIRENGVVSIPDNVMMQDFEIAELFEVMIPMVRANIRVILKTNITTADCTNGATLVGCNIVPDYHGLDMVVTLAFRIQSTQSEVFRHWVLRRCIATERQPIVLQYNYSKFYLSEQN